MKKKKLILLLTSFSAVTVSLSVLLCAKPGFFKSIATAKPSSLQCDYYFNEENGYTSIYDLNYLTYNSFAPTTYKSWGTITNKYVSSTKTCYYVQSTDRNGNSAGTLLYNCSNTSLEEGNVVTFSSGTLSVYNGQPQVTAPDITKDYSANPSPVVYRNVDYSDFTYSSESEKQEKIYKANSLVIARGVKVSNIQNTSAFLTFNNDSSKTIKTFYGSSTLTNDIRNRFSNMSSSNIDVIGHIANYNGTFQLYVRSDEYISYSSDGLLYITATCNHGKYELYETPVIGDFTVVAYYGDGTSETIFYGASVDSWDYTDKFVTISYTEDYVTKTVNVPIEVVEDDPEKEVVSIEAYNPQTEYIYGADFVKPQLKVTYTTGTEYISSGYSLSTIDMEELGRQEVTLTFGEHQTSYEIMISSSGSDFESFDLNSNTFSLGTKVYDTGNYGTYNDIGYYRINNGSKTSTFDLLPYDSIFDTGISIDPRPGAIFANNPFKDIKSLTLKYSTSTTSGTLLPKISFGENSYTDVGSIDFSYTSEVQALTFEPSEHNINYFKIECGDTKLTIVDLYIEYYDSETEHGSDIVIDTNYVDYRINPTTYSGYLESGVTSVTVPYDVSINTVNNTYTVNEYKTYIYYDLEYAEAHPQMINEIALIDPVDIANYYNIFKKAPANYALSSDLDECKDVFGSLARSLKKYTKTDGYALSVPYTSDYSGRPLYYEFDISLDSSYTTSNRGVGRVVGWEYGFNTMYGYNSSPVCVYTDDHYATFQEFNNLGGWCHRFDAEMITLCRQWKQSTIVTQA